MIFCVCLPGIMEKQRKLSYKSHGKSWNFIIRFLGEKAPAPLSLSLCCHSNRPLLCPQIILGILFLFPCVWMEFRSKEELQLMPQTVEEHIHERGSDSDSSSTCSETSHRPHQVATQFFIFLHIFFRYLFIYCYQGYTYLFIYLYLYLLLCIYSFIVMYLVILIYLFVCVYLFIFIYLFYCTYLFIYLYIFILFFMCAQLSSD